MTETRMIYRVTLQIKNSRTGQVKERMVESDGNGKFTDYGVESLLALGADLYSSGWEKQDFEVTGRETKSTAVLNAKKRG